MAQTSLFVGGEDHQPLHLLFKQDSLRFVLAQSGHHRVSDAIEMHGNEILGLNVFEDHVLQILVHQVINGDKGKIDLLQR